MQMNVKEILPKTTLDADGDVITKYTVKMEGTNGQAGYSKVKMKLTIESENETLLEEWVPMDMYASRNLRLDPVNRTLSEFAEKPDEIEV